MTERLDTFTCMLVRSLFIFAFRPLQAVEATVTASKGGPISAPTAAAGGGDAPSVEDLQRQGRAEQEGRGISGFSHPAKFRQPSADFEHPEEYHEDVSRLRHKRVLFGRAAAEQQAAILKAAARERKMRRSRRAR